MQNILPALYSLTIAFAPSFAWLVFVLKKDIHPERVRDISFVFIIGILSAIPILMVGFLIQSTIVELNLDIAPVFASFLTGAVNEELMKVLLLYFFAMTAQFWDEPIDIFIYAATIALGFAGIENFVVALSRLDSIGNGLESLLLIRSITAVLVHIMSTFFFGYALAVYRNKKNIGVLIVGALASIGFHGLYNYSLQISQGNFEIFQLFYLVVFVPCFLYMLYLVKELQSESQ